MLQLQRNTENTCSSFLRFARQLTNLQSPTAPCCLKLAQNGGREIFACPDLTALFDESAADPGTPDIAVAPNFGVVYTGTMEISEHSGFAHDDTDVVIEPQNPTHPLTVVTESVQPIK